MKEEEKKRISIAQWISAKRFRAKDNQNKNRTQKK